MPNRPATGSHPAVPPVGQELRPDRPRLEAIPGDSVGPGVFELELRDLMLGRTDDCDLRLPETAPVSRRHARLLWREGRFHVRDEGGALGTTLNARVIAPGEEHALVDGDELTFGQLHYRYIGPEVESRRAAGNPSERTALARYASFARELAGLDPLDVVRNGLALLRWVSGVSRAHIVATQVPPELAGLVTPLDDPDLEVSQSSIERALAEGRKVTHAVVEESETIPTVSGKVLALRRVWVAPIAGPDGRPLAAIYLGSSEGGTAFAPEVEALLDAVTAHLGQSLRNALLHAELVRFNQVLESRIEIAVRQHEEVRLKLVAQDRLATLGRLVAGIAHELNNPIGAIASFSRTLADLGGPLLTMQQDLDRMDLEPGHRMHAEALLLEAFRRAGNREPDRAGRDAREVELANALAARGFAPGMLARRLARLGFDVPLLESNHELLAAEGEAILTLAERVHTFGRSLAVLAVASTSVARIVHGLKTYAHLDQAESEVADLHAGVEATLDILSSRIPDGIEVVREFGPVEPLRHRPGELIQVWTNLIDNAIGAMGQSGTLTITSEEADGIISISVGDTGGGVPESVRDRLFELDVTTKGPGAGLGLGLPICRTIVEQHHGGRIRFESEPGRTVFTVSLPRVGTEGEVAP